MARDISSRGALAANTTSVAAVANTTSANTLASKEEQMEMRVNDITAEALKVKTSMDENKEEEKKVTK